MKKSTLIAIALSSAVVAGGIWWWQADPSDPAAVTDSADGKAPGALSPEQIKRLGIRTEAAVAASALELGAIPAIVTLPPEARVGVSTLFGGTVVRVLVVNGQTVTRGQALAVIRSVEPVQYGAALARGQAQLAVAQATAQRTAQLVKEGIYAPARGDEAQAELRRAQADVSENRRLLAQSGAGSSGVITLRAPITGRIAAVNVQTGGPVDTMTAPFVVENTANLMLDLQVPERLANDIRPGLELSVALPGGQTASGTVVSVGGSLDAATRSIPATARLGDAPGLVSGKAVMAVLKGTQQADGISVPAAAVTRMGDSDVVFVATPAGFAVRKVTVAGSGGTRTALSTGLKPGERVAVSGISELKVILGGE
ncbi:efflux RND transporter periplasmic adaptor subunit [Novosphingobium sp.]|uniref:efflux RND transporter periplasmic adaptor subunit n=1 Tax=Novosphingobium sp. TaxID=1874826 RepID=UPI00273323D2|nr:efflux RND transporter periplasmic adaptor subunit [Novosphingobium sp.]MDP3907814.1 efflux RND transporter periplasmic adaptor subunit [Novosphingobium sp.]